MLHLQGKTEEGKQELLRRISLDPKLEYVYAELGRVLLDEGEAESALERFQQAIATDPTDPVAQFGLTLTLQRLGRPEEAIEHCYRALELVPDDPLFLQTLVELEDAHTGGSAPGG